MSVAPHTARHLSKVLTINGGSSSIRFALFKVKGSPRRMLAGKLDRIGQRGTNLTVLDPDGEPGPAKNVETTNLRSSISSLIDELGNLVDFTSGVSIGHRIVHGMDHTEPERVTPALLAELERISPIDPDHLPCEIELIKEFARRYPSLDQVVCFDTAFHQTMPPIARLLPIPRRFAEKGIRRYGFHGLSYSFLLEELDRIGDPAARSGRVILAHLGSGASLAAVRDGRSIDTSMGFTATAGLVMGTRTGDLDPGVISYLSSSEHMSAAKLQDMVNHKSGLLGVSETSSDMRDLLANEHQDARAAEAIELFCYQTKKWIGAYTAALDGLDTLVFSGGIGENAPVVRQRICDGLGRLGIELDKATNAEGAPSISKDGSQVTVRVIRTNEELMIARSVARLLGKESTQKV